MIEEEKAFVAENNPYSIGELAAAMRAEIEKGKGTQFDPGFASIMLEMIDEDTDYTMREK